MTQDSVVTRTKSDQTAKPRPQWRGRLWRWASKAHLWIGIVVGVQAILWLASGFMMTWLDLDTVHGDHLVHRHRQPLPVAADIQPPAAVIATASTLKPDGLTLGWLGDRLVYRVSGKDASGKDNKALFDARTGQRLDPLPAGMARAIAQAGYQGDGKVVRASLLTTEPGDYRRDLPVWQIQFDDAESTRFYVSPKTGEIVSVRNDSWRLFDWFWMLHIMDYDTRDDFNHPLIRCAALLGLGLGLSGLVLMGLKLTRPSSGKGASGKNGSRPSEG